MKMEMGYMISDASKMVEVENHVLRYWEEELELPIPRNEMGHRYYRESDIKLLRQIKDLKEQGFQLRAIKKLLPDLGRLETLDPKGLYQLREELNHQVMLESMEGAKGSVTSLNQARDRYEKRQKTWQERSFELEQARGKSVQPSVQENQRQASLDKLRQFESMMRQMIRSTMNEISKESEQRICEAVTVKLQKEMNYLLLQKEELQEKQITLLKQILQQVKREELEDGNVKKQPSQGIAGKETGNRETAIQETEAEREVAVTQEKQQDSGKRGKEKKGFLRKKEKAKKKKLFAKSV